MSNLFRYVKINGYDNWFLVLKGDEYEPDNLSEKMQERILRSEICLHDKSSKAKNDSMYRIMKAATHTLDYENLASKYGTILIRPIGSFMTLADHEITDEKYDTDFPIEDFAEIVICENDKSAEQKWVKYLENRFSVQKILTINFFDLRSEKEIEKYFSKAKIITFSTTFSDFSWYEKLSRHVSESHAVIGFCHDEDKWEEALQIHKDIEIISKI